MRESDVLTTSDFTLALSAACEAGELLLAYRGKSLIEHKGDKNLVTDADRASEALIVKMLQEARPHDEIVAEEGSFIAGESGRRWIIDPLDGTNNYAHNFLAFAVSIALEVDGQLTVGVVHAPAMGKIFAARLGGGATLNGEPIQVSRTERLSESLCATGFPYARKTLKRNNLAEFNRVMMEVQGIRRVGAAALDLCWVAAGRWDGYWEMGLQPWDVAAGMLIVHEAGGLLTDFKGGPVDVFKPEVVATNGLIHRQLLDLLAQRE